MVLDQYEHATEDCEQTEADTDAPKRDPLNQRDQGTDSEIPHDRARDQRMLGEELYIGS